MHDSTSPEHPWEDLESLVESAPVQELDDYLDSLPAGETARVISRLEDESQARLLVKLDPGEAADLIEELSDAQAANLLELLPPEAAASIVAEMPSQEQADLLGALPTADAEAILQAMPHEAARSLRQLYGYKPDTAGGLMGTELLSYPQKLTVAAVIDDMRAKADDYRDYQVQYAYVIDARRRLVGVLPLRDLLLARPDQRIDSLMVANPLTVEVEDSLDELRDFFERHDFLGVPVVDHRHRLLGVVRRASVNEALGDRSTSDYRKSQGIVREELRTMPVFVRARRRLAWLSVNILLNVVAASVIAVYRDTLEQVIALAIFLPIISDMSGCSGNQAVAVSMRELSLGLVRPNEVLRVWGKEVAVGLINGLALGLLIAVVARIYEGEARFGLVVGGAMAINTLVAVSLGGTLPLLLRKLNVDPALASGPILTTFTDMCGFFLALTFAATLLV